MSMKNLDELELWELVMSDEEDGVYANSLVSSPAIERDFIFFNKEQIHLQSVNEEKRLVAGPILIPNKKILRVDENGFPYAIYFTPETIEKMSRKFMKNKLNNEITIEHGGSKVGGVYLTETWLVEQTGKDKSNIWNYNLPRGSWFGVYKVENDKVWEMIKSGELKGFSVEMLADHIPAKVNPKTLLSTDVWDLSIEDLTEDQAQIILKEISGVLKKKVQLETYSDYGQEIRNNAKRGIELNDKVNNKCATQVGKVRAQQLADGEPISVETIKRMYSYLSRAETYYDETDTTKCGTISYLLWGGKSALSWSRNKLRELGELEENEGINPSIPNSTYPGEVLKPKEDESK